MVIESDSDLPKCLNTYAKQSKKARQVASAHTGKIAKKARGPSPQGFFSRTIIVTFQDGTEIVIQFRPEKLDVEPFVLARKVLGPVVPDVELVDDEELHANSIWTYAMTLMPGKTWLDGIAGKGSAGRISINRSLGRILSQGLVEGDSEAVTQKTIRSHLHVLLESDDSGVSKFHDTIRDLLANVGQLKQLPLFIAHFDINEVNIMINEQCEVTGLIDWELSTPLPLGMGFCRIHTIAGEYSDGEFYMPPEFEEAERAFWQEIYNGAPDVVRGIFDTKPELVQFAVNLGTLLDAFQLEDGKLDGYNQVAFKALPKHLSYRIPQLRGKAPPYSK